MDRQVGDVYGESVDFYVRFWPHARKGTLGLGVRAKKVGLRLRKDAWRPDLPTTVAPIRGECTVWLEGTAPAVAKSVVLWYVKWKDSRGGLRLRKEAR